MLCIYRTSKYEIFLASAPMIPIRIVSTKTPLKQRLIHARNFLSGIHIRGISSGAKPAHCCIVNPVASQISLTRRGERTTRVKMCRQRTVSGGPTRIKPRNERTRCPEADQKRGTVQKPMERAT